MPSHYFFRDRARKDESTSVNTPRPRQKLPRMNDLSPIGDITLLKIQVSYNSSLLKYSHNVALCLLYDIHFRESCRTKYLLRHSHTIFLRHP